MRILPFDPSAFIKILSKGSLLKPDKVVQHYGCRSYRNVKTESTILEVSQGVGGSEAMLFTEELLEIYIKLTTLKNWPYKILEMSRGDLGGINSAKLEIMTPYAFEGLLQEAGVHRVQRTPKTERHGRMHTSTASVAVLPKSVIDLQIKDSDLEIQTKKASGPGGQHVNKREMAIRMFHKPSGIAVESSESRSQKDNLSRARQKLLTKLQNLELQSITSSFDSLRRTQMGTADRNEKIRTYNFPQDRITDHRINKSYQNLRSLFSGDVQVLVKMIEDFNQNTRG